MYLEIILQIVLEMRIRLELAPAGRCVRHEPSCARRRRSARAPPPVGVRRQHLALNINQTGHRQRLHRPGE